MIFRLNLCALVLMMLMPHAPARADHAPEWLLSKRSTAPRVLDLSIDATSLREVIARFGKPESTSTDPTFPAEAEYTWRFDGAVLKVSTMFPPARRTPASESVTSIEIAAGDGTERVLTEHGLKFGDTLQVLVQTYGWRYVTHWHPSTGAESAVATFIFQDESELSAAFDDDGRLVRLYVGASVE